MDVKPKKTVTQEDVARLAGVTRGVASVVLNNTKSTVRVSDDTRVRVQEAADRLRYRPNAVARGLARGRMDAIGVVYPHAYFSFVTDPYFGPILDGILTGAMLAHQNTTLFTGHMWSDMEQSLSIYGDGRCDGLLLIAPALTTDIVPALKSEGIRFAVISAGQDDPSVTSINTDDAASARELVSYLIDLGHRRIALLGGGADSGSALRRAHGFRAAFADRGLPCDESLIHWGKYREESGFEQARAVFHQVGGSRPTALVCGNDELALGAMEACIMEGLRVPLDISITGFDDAVFAATMDPPLTTVRQPLRLLGERAIEALLAQIRGESGPGRKELLLAERIVRGSTGPVRPG